MLPFNIFFINGFLTKGLNSRILALTPKRDATEKTKDYWPILLCIVIYKVISKILANCFKFVPSGIISLNKSTFVKERLLMENVFLASEIVKDYHKDS